MQLHFTSLLIIAPVLLRFLFFFFFFNDTATTEIYPLSLHDALPIYGARRLFALRARPSLRRRRRRRHGDDRPPRLRGAARRSEEHTSELQSPCNLVCRLLLEKKKRRQETARSHVCSRLTTKRYVYTL